MFDIGGWAECLLIVVVAFVVIGPKDLPKVLFKVGKGIRYLRGLAHVANQRLEDFIETENFNSSEKTNRKSASSPPTRHKEGTSEKAAPVKRQNNKASRKKGSHGPRRPDATS